MNLVRMSASAGVNPFSLIRDEVGIIEFAECFIANTTGDKDHVGDQFWVQAERLLYTALIGYLMFYCPPEDRNFGGLVWAWTTTSCCGATRPSRTPPARP